MIEISIPIWLLLAVGVPTYLLAGVGAAMSWNHMLYPDRLDRAGFCIVLVCWPLIASLVFATAVAIAVISIFCEVIG